MRSWYSWLISQNLYLPETDTIRIGLEHSNTSDVVECLYPYPPDEDKSARQVDAELKEAFSFESMVQRIEIVDNILAKCVTL